MQVRGSRKKRPSIANTASTKKRRTSHAKQEPDTPSASGSQSTTKTQQACEYPDQDEEMPDSKPRTALMDLPKELLVEIIGHVLTVPEPIILREASSQRWVNEIADLRENRVPESCSPPWCYITDRRRMRKSPLLRVIRVNKDFYFAGLEAYFTHNTFYFDSVYHLDDITPRLTPRHKSLFSKVTIDMCWTTLEDSPPDPPPYAPVDVGVFEEDVWQAFPKLKEVVVNSFMDIEFYSNLAVKSEAEKVQSHIQGLVERGWPSVVGRMRFLFPKHWGSTENEWDPAEFADLEE